MVDFRSALYLGMSHAHRGLPPWTRLTKGLPAALEPPDGSEALCKKLAKTLGVGSATLGTSTFHLFWDLFGVLASEPLAIYMDSGLYPVVRWGVERVLKQGVATFTFPTHNPIALKALLERDRRSGIRPVVVTDGLSPATGRTAPLPDYLQLVRERNGYLVIDDTQALGILGRNPGTANPYGHGGGGTPAWHGLEGPELIVGSSMAKGFGVPLGILTGNSRVISQFNSQGSTQVHCSPPSAALISAATQALAINREQGERLRNRLISRVLRFKAGLREIGLNSSGGLFPVQTLKPVIGLDMVELHDRLTRLEMLTVLHKSVNKQVPKLSFLLTAQHSTLEIDQCIQALQHLSGLTRLRRKGQTMMPIERRRPAMA